MSQSGSSDDSEHEVDLAQSVMKLACRVETLEQQLQSVNEEVAGTKGGLGEVQNEIGTLHTNIQRLKGSSIIIVFESWGVQVITV